MFLIRLQNFDLLMDAASLLNLIQNEADVKFSRSKFSIIASRSIFRFVATLQISHRFFTEYSVDKDQSWRISLQPFFNAVYDGIVYSSMAIHLPETTGRMILKYEYSTLMLPQLSRELELSPPQEEELDQIDHDKFFSIMTKDFRKIVRQIDIYPIPITLTNSQVKFHIPSEEIILTKEGGGCVIVGYEREVETQFGVTLHPKSFFLQLSYQTERVWFYKTVNSRTVIFFPAFGLDAQYVIYFS